MDPLVLFLFNGGSTAFICRTTALELEQCGKGRIDREFGTLSGYETR